MPCVAALALISVWPQVKQTVLELMFEFKVQVSEEICVLESSEELIREAVAVHQRWEVELSSVERA